MAASQLGLTVRALRHASGRTLGEVAGSSGLSPAFVSQIESGRANPTVSALSRLAEALGVSLATLFDRPGRAVDPTGGRAHDLPFEPVVRPVSDTLPPTTEGRVRELSAPGATMLRACLASGPPLDHAVPTWHAGEEICLVLDGSYRLEVGSWSRMVDAGSLVHYPARTVHRLVPGSARSRALLVLDDGA